MRVLKKLSKFNDENGYFLAGGTAVSIHLGHRKSIDLDFFRLNTKTDPILLMEILNKYRIKFNHKSSSIGGLHVTIDGVRVSFIDYNYKTLEEPERWNPFRTNIASLQDLAAMKMNAMHKRYTKKDFIDMYMIMNHLDLDVADVLSIYQRKHNTESVEHLLPAFTYFKNADAEPSPKRIKTIDWRKVKSFLRTKVKEYYQTK